MSCCYFKYFSLLFFVLFSPCFICCSSATYCWVPLNRHCCHVRGVATAWTCPTQLLRETFPEIYANPASFYGEKWSALGDRSRLELDSPVLKKKYREWSEFSDSAGHPKAKNLCWGSSAQIPWPRALPLYPRGRCMSPLRTRHMT